MDFFAPNASRVAVSATGADAPDPFAEAIGRRFSGPAAPMLTAKLVLEESPLDNPALHADNTRPTSMVPSLAEAGRTRSSQTAATLSNMSIHSPARKSSPAASSSAGTPSDVSRFVAVAPKDLSIYLTHEPPPLIIDVRSSGAHAVSHVHGAISLSVPSTLLKRPNFPLANMATMIPSPTARAAFAQWSSAERILVYDTDLSRLADGSGVLGLLRKFATAGSKAELSWLVGGHNAVARLARDCLEAGGTPASDPEHTSAVTNGAFVHAHSLPQSAFQQSSTIGGPSHKPNKLQASNPFYDNIRQNRELSHGITERIPLELSKDVISRKHEIPVPWIREIVENGDGEKGIEALAMQFYRIELGEQRRLQGVMSHHSRESLNGISQQPDDPMSDLDTHDPFPFSITAGVEKGTKNRYKNIWPYEHARVRLQSATDDGSDYVNASHVRPRGTNLQYIATQGPMPATYVDFWTMVWEQHVHVIVMLTRQVEGNQLKCGDYWSGTQFGPLRLQLIAVEGGEEEVVEKPTGFDFGFDDKKVEEEPQPTIRRTFALSHTGHPEEPPRKIVQFQFLSWLDMYVPETPGGLLALVKDVREAAEEADKHDPSAKPNPVLVHCSAGVGRTGSFVAIDAILDGVRRELEAVRSLSLEPSSSDDPSDSDLDTSADPSTDSVGSFKVRRESFPEDMTTHRKPTNLHMTSSRPRRMSLRKTLGAKKGTSLGPAEKYLSKKLHSNAGAMPGSSSINGTNSASSLPSSNPSASLYFTDGSLPVSATTLASAPQSNGNRMSPPKLAPSVMAPSAMQATRAWSSQVADNTSRSDLAAPQPVPAALSRDTPRPDSEMRDHDRDTFDYVLPRSLVPKKPVSPLGSMDEPIREVVEDMREQRMSLCQSLRQYVFIHRAVVEGALTMVDESKKRKGESNSGVGAKRHASPTELVKVDKAGSRAQIKKRPSLRLGKDGMMVDS